MRKKSASVSVDRYSNSSNVLVHFILDSNSLFKLTKEREKDHTNKGGYRNDTSIFSTT